MDALFDVAFLVAVDLSLPELAIVLGRHEVLTAFVTVPEAAVDEDDGAVLAQRYVGCAGQSLDIYAVAVAMGMQVASRYHLGLGIIALDARYAPVLLFFCSFV